MTDLYQESLDEPIDILLVEDNPGDARLTEEAFELTETETTVHVVTTRDDAVDFLRQQGAFSEAPLPALVLLDLDLPGGDGCEVLEALRDDNRLQCLPVIIFTSSETEEDIDEFRTIAETVERFWFEQATLPPAPA